MLTEKEINIIFGKLIVNKLTPSDSILLMQYISDLEKLLDQADEEDFFGSEGWRHRIGLE